MLEALKSLFENNVISEEVRSDIEKAWENKITENRNEVSQQLREEFATRYEHDKGLIVEAMDRIMSEQLKEEIAQFLDDRKQLAEQKARYVVIHPKGKLSEGSTASNLQLSCVFIPFV